MREELSIKANNEEIEIKTNKADMAAALVRGIVGAAPVVGPMVAEAISANIPNQKLERVIIFMKVLEDKIKYIEESILKETFRSEEFADLLEDALHQASRALSDERRHYIASLLKNGLAKDDLTHIEKKKLLSILNELNDVEILRLKFYSLKEVQKRNDFKAKHKNIVMKKSLTYGAAQEEVDKAVFFDAYRNHLIQLELVVPEYRMPDRDGGVEFDKQTGKLKATYWKTTDLGDLLIRYIDADEVI